MEICLLSINNPANYPTFFHWDTECCSVTRVNRLRFKGLAARCMSNRRTFACASQQHQPWGTIHLHPIFSRIHMFPFQQRIICYHQITVLIRWTGCDSAVPPPPREHQAKRSYSEQAALVYSNVSRRRRLQRGETDSPRLPCSLPSVLTVSDSSGLAGDWQGSTCVR